MSFFIYQHLKNLVNPAKQAAAAWNVKKEGISRMLYFNHLETIYPVSGVKYAIYYGYQ